MGLEEARNSFAIAERKLRQASSLDLVKHPGEVIHDAYYAMHHAAKALILATTSKTPYRHETVIEELDKLLGPPEKVHGLAINHAASLRLGEDYDSAEPVTSEEASDVLKAASDLVNFVRTRMS